MQCYITITLKSTYSAFWVHRPNYILAFQLYSPDFLYKETAFRTIFHLYSLILSTHKRYEYIFHFRQRKQIRNIFDNELSLFVLVMSFRYIFFSLFDCIAFADELTCRNKDVLFIYHAISADFEGRKSTWSL